jgi:cyclopropane-fatty-acyl-phospholipid synthase
MNTQIGKRAFQVGHKHYDLGNDMYELMLGESMGYSSGKYNAPTDDLTKAQYNKFDSLCKKLDLKPGMKVLEIGAGWGSFARHAAKEYGVEVTGLTISKEQKAYAEKRCKGLPVKFLLLDYQKLGKKYFNYFDRVVSIEMIEAVGKKNLATYFSVINKALKKDGLVGLQAIVGSGYDDSFLSTRIFPNGHVPSVIGLTKGFGRIFRLKSWESFGKDYDKTLLAWDENFQKHWKQISKLTDDRGNTLYDEKFYRMWHYYLMVCAAAFRVDFNDVAQIVLSRSVTPIARF